MCLIFFFLVLLSRWDGRCCYWNFGRNVKTFVVGNARKQSLRKTEEKRQANLRVALRYVYLYAFQKVHKLINNNVAEKQIDLKSVDLKKLKVRDLKKILNDWDETCDGCLEKADFIKRIEELKPKHIREEL